MHFWQNSFQACLFNLYFQKRELIPYQQSHYSGWLKACTQSFVEENYCWTTKTPNLLIAWKEVGTWLLLKCSRQSEIFFGWQPERHGHLTESNQEI